MERTERHGPLMGDNQNSRATTVRIPDRKECLTPDRPRKPTEFCAVAHSEGSGSFAQDALETLEILACHGEIPAIKIGKKWRFRGGGLAQWLSCESGAQLRNRCFVSERAQAHPSVVVHGPPSDSENARGCKGG